jgi:hypothetical protein
MPETARWIGGFIRWLLKGCKTRLQDEVEGNFNAVLGGTYDTENYIIGVATVVIILGVVVLIVF